ncbi:hypothetical protein BHE74_00004828 [Ensete ventricosum]|nr:hypothetical protein BHE74_00004828 [Ensete ventricosum]
MIRFPPPKIRWTGFSRPKRRKILDLTASATSDAFDFSSSESEEEEESPPWIFPKGVGTAFIFSMSVSPGCSAAMVRIASPKPPFSFSGFFPKGVGITKGAWANERGLYHSKMRSGPSDRSSAKSSEREKDRYRPAQGASFLTPPVSTWQLTIGSRYDFCLKLTTNYQRDADTKHKVESKGEEIITTRRRSKILETLGSGSRSRGILSERFESYDPQLSIRLVIGHDEGPRNRLRDSR